MAAGRRAEPDAPASGAVVGSLSADAAQVDWPDTIRTLLRVVRPYRGQLAVTVADAALGG